MGKLGVRRQGAWLGRCRMFLEETLGSATPY